MINDGFSATAFWTADAGVAIDSRMIFGPFEIGSGVNTTLEFLEQYLYGDFVTDSNLVEISIDGGDSWQTIFTSDPSILENWTSRLIDLSSFEGEFILLS